MKYQVLILLLVLSACSTPRPLFTEDGRPTLQTQCIGNNWQKCEQQARLICRADQFDVIKATINGSYREMLYACKKNS